MTYWREPIVEREPHPFFWSAVAGVVFWSVVAWAVFG